MGRSRHHEARVEAARRAGWKVLNYPGRPRPYYIVAPTNQVAGREYKYRETAELGMIGLYERSRGIRSRTRSNPTTDTEVALAGGITIMVLGLVGFLIVQSKMNQAAAAANAVQGVPIV